MAERKRRAPARKRIPVAAQAAGSIVVHSHSTLLLAVDDLGQQYGELQYYLTCLTAIDLACKYSMERPYSTFVVINPGVASWQAGVETLYDGDEADSVLKSLGVAIEQKR